MKFIVKLLNSRVALSLLRIMFTCISFLPQKKKTIVFESFHGKQYSDNPRALYEYIKSNYKEYELIWSVDRRNTTIFEEYKLPYMKKFSFKWFLLMPRAKYWIVNVRLPNWIPKPKNTIYLQTWHGTPLKRLGVDIENIQMPGTNNVLYRKNFLKEANKWDYLISPNSYSTDIFKRAFGFKKTIIESGYPRNDFIINANKTDKIRKIKELNNIPVDKKVILYAPTWRDNQYYSVGRYKFEIHMDLDLLKKSIGDEYIIFLRLHYLVAEHLDLSKYQGFVYDFSKHEDIRELYLMSDLLITDYSSVFFDYANLHRPMIFYVYDIEEYRDNLRGFYFDFESSAPGPMVKTTEELIVEIENLKRYGFIQTDKYKNFINKFCYLEDGKASKRVVDVLLK